MSIALRSHVLLAALFALFCAAMASAQTLTTLASFDSSNGAWPAAPLIQGADGNFYGTTEIGGNPGTFGFC